MRVAILLTTYNGEDYLQELLDSLYAQTYSDWGLFIYDDGSIDRTLNIIAENQQRYSNIYLLKNDNCNLGAKNAFMWLLEQVDADYYMFCDQDDVWLPNKVEVSLKQIKLIEGTTVNKPVLIYTDLTVVNEKLDIIHPSFWYYSRILPEVLKNFDYLSVHNAATGCTIIMNDALKKISLPVPDIAEMHDSWLALCAAKYGTIDYVKDATILYRQHGKNVVGAENLRNSYLKKKIRTISTIIKNNKTRLRVLNLLGKRSLFSYWKYKILYFIKVNQNR